jgi:serpin B
MRARTLLSGIALSLAACSGEPPSAPITELPRPLSQSEARLIAADNRFAFKLFRETLARERADRNVFLSPVSVAMALGMAWNGAGGATRDSMSQALELAGLTSEEVNGAYRSLIDLLRGLDRGVTFTIANSVWYRQTLTPAPTFVAAMQSAFDAQVRALDFTSPDAGPTINAWASEQTRGRIPEIVPRVLPADIVAYLVNAIYFKGAWTQRFDPALTATGPFQLRGGGTSQVSYMSAGTEVPLRFAADAQIAILDLPYAGGAWSMTIVLPASGVSLDSVAAGLTQARWDAWIAALDSTARPVVLPRFTLHYDLDSANAVLKALGVRIAYCDEPPFAFDFTPMFPQAQACISDVKHKTFVEVNEEGTEAAAVTSVGVGVTSMPVELRVDRPFLVAIRERFSGTILFLGRIMNPAAGP